MNYPAYNINRTEVESPVLEMDAIDICRFIFPKMSMNIQIKICVTRAAGYPSQKNSAELGPPMVIEATGLLTRHTRLGEGQLGRG